MSEQSESHIESARLRRSPRYGVFLTLGVALGLLTALILTYGVGTDAVSASTGVVYERPQVLGFLALIFGTVGLAVGGLVALVLDRVLARRTRTVRIDHQTVHGDTVED